MLLFLNNELNNVLLSNQYMQGFFFLYYRRYTKGLLWHLNLHCLAHLYSVKERHMCASLHSFLGSEWFNVGFGIIRHNFSLDPFHDCN